MCCAGCPRSLQVLCGGSYHGYVRGSTRNSGRRAEVVKVGRQKAGEEREALKTTLPMSYFLALARPWAECWTCPLPHRLVVGVWVLPAIIIRAQLHPLTLQYPLPGQSWSLDSFLAPTVCAQLYPAHLHPIVSDFKPHRKFLLSN